MPILSSKDSLNSGQLPLLYSDNIFIAHYLINHFTSEHILGHSFQYVFYV